MNLNVYNYKIKDTNKYLNILILHWWMHEKKPNLRECTSTLGAPKALVAIMQHI